MNLQRTGLLIALCLTAFTACDGRPSATGVNAAASASTAPAASAPANSQERVVVGTLGGMKVRIPWHFVNLMEFSGEPTDWKGGPKSPVSRPAGATRDIASFGFEVRYPDMAGLSTPALRSDHDQRPFKVNPWMDVTITSGDLYRPRALAAMASAIREPLSDAPYLKAASDVDTLERHVAQGVNPKTKQPARLDLLNPDVYLAFDPPGQASAVIRCSNTEIGRQACVHAFVLEPQARVFVQVRYGRDMLPEWQDIQRRTRALLLGFRID